MSSIYFDNQLPLGDASSVRCVAWSCDEDAPFLAIAEANHVRIFRDEGEEIADATQSRGVACTSLAWHPRSKVLAAGWEDGTVTFAAVQGSGSPREDREVHRDAGVQCIVYNPAGTRCITTDGNGVVGVWKTDNRGMLSQLCHYRKNGCHDKVIFRTMTSTMTHSLEPNLDNPPFFFGGELGTIYLADDFGLCSERYKVGSPIILMEYYHQKDMVIVITKNVILAQFTLDAEGRVCNETKLKLSCGPMPEKLQGTWAGPGLLATCSHESIVRLWNLADDENYILSLQGVDERNTLAGDKVTSIHFNPRKRMLAAGTRGGRLVQWRCSVLSGTPSSESCWQVLPVINASESCGINKITWGPGESLLHIMTERSCLILSEGQLNTAVRPPFMVLQTAPMQVLVYNMEQGTRGVLTAPFRVRGLGIGESYIMLWNSKQVSIYEIEGRAMSTSVTSSFMHEASPIISAALIIQGAQRSVVIATAGKLEFTNLQGHVQKTIQFSPEVEGAPICLDVNGQKDKNGPYLVCSTTTNMIKVWNVSRAQPKPIGTPVKFEGPDETPLGDIRSVRINCDGTRVSMLVDQRIGDGPQTGTGAAHVPDTRVFVYDVDTENFINYSAGPNRVPVSHAWECNDPRLMSVEVAPQAVTPASEGTPVANGTEVGLQNGDVDVSGEALNEQANSENQHAVLTLFVSGAEKILLQDSIPCADPSGNGVPRMPCALLVPHIYFVRQLGDLGSAGLATETGETNDGASAVISRTTLRDFVGLETVDAETTLALVDFSFHIACGNTDEAYKSVKGVKSFGVWESMSKMCVKTGRLDVAQKCLGQMGHARAAGALRACDEPEEDAKLAIVAAQLDMIEDAERLLKKCGRWDLLNRLYQACGEWEKALQVAKTKDRMHLKPTHYAYAQHLESIEDVRAALNHFELSGTYRTESPRLLCALGMSDALEAYVEQSDDMHLHKWYAQYLESKANLEGASREYKKAGDWLSLCRVACFNKDMDRAQKICEESQDAAACYHLARHMEADGRTKDAIRYFQASGRTSHALRLAQESNYDVDLMGLALSADTQSMAQAAKYYEQKGQHSKAVVLYQKAGCQKRALELCFSARLFSELRKIADELSADSDPEILAKCAEFFMQHSQHDKAVHLLSMSGQFDKAVGLCDEHNVTITEDMAERMTPEKGAVDPAHRADILNRVATLCKKQGSFQLACKKFTQAGDKLKAMKSLLKSGDTEKIIFFAGTARQQEIYVLAGNYLQGLDWHSDPEIMKNIILFYGKAKAYEKLAAFYDACAQVEIDEYRDYAKASGALREALKYAIKAAGGAAETDAHAQALQAKIALVDRFAAVKQMAKSDPEQMIQICGELLQTPDLESAVRVGDVYAQLIEHFAETGQLEQAHAYVESMRERGILLTPYLDRNLLTRIYAAVGLQPPDTEPGAAAAHEDVDEEIEEEDDN